MCMLHHWLGKNFDCSLWELKVHVVLQVLFSVYLCYIRGWWLATLINKKMLATGSQEAICIWVCTETLIYW
jgi:hypothetical protein